MRFGRKDEKPDILTTWSTGYTGRNVVGESYHESEVAGISGPEKGDPPAIRQSFLHCAASISAASSSVTRPFAR